MALRSYLLGSTGLMNSILAGNDAADSNGTRSINYANVVLNIRNSIYQYFNLTPPKEQYVVVWIQDMADTTLVMVCTTWAL